MSRRWPVWICIATLMLVLAATMSWLSVEAWRGDRLRAQAESSAQLEKKASIALWRIDSLLAPILAREATYPPRVYRQIADSMQPRDDRIPTDFIAFRFHWPVEDVELSATASIANPDSSPGPTSYDELAQRISCPDLMRCTPSTLVPQPDDRSIASASISSEAIPTPNNSIVQNRVHSNSANGNEFNARSQGLQFQAAQQVINQDFLYRDIATTDELGATAPIWVDDWLLLVRRVKIESTVAIQGCRLDWDRLQREAAESVSDLFPQVALVPARFEDEKDERRLAGLPVELVIPQELTVVPWTALKTAVVGGWCAMIGALSMMFAFMVGAMRLEEKRASFVSAVTHELRTPLTTFRMYADMLQRNIVPVDARQEYLKTLCQQSDRLCHLIDNVLTFSRLERGRHSVNFQTFLVDEMFRDIVPRLRQRCEQSGMEWVFETDRATRAITLRTDPDSVDQILANLVDNACKYARDAIDSRVILRVESNKDWIRMRVIDHGPGLAADARQKLFQAFSKSAEQAAVSQPGVGLGLALSQRIAKSLRGQLLCQSVPNGCEMVLELPVKNDR